VRHVLRDYGFPLLVFADLAGSVYLAATVQVPASVPDYALQASAVYRLEVAAACFIVVYLAAMALFLALDGRGFAEIGTRGLRASQIIRAADAEQDVTLAEQIEVSQALEERLKTADAKLRDIIQCLDDQEERLASLEPQTID
jgi:hypothetical protein